MKSKIINIIKLVVFFSIGILLVWLSFKDLSDNDISEIKKSFLNANYFWLFVSICIGMLSHIIRAHRWNMLADSLGYKPKFSNSFFAVMVGYLVNYGVPRLGEISRCTVLNKYEKIPFTQSFGTVVAERVLDLIFYFLIVITMIFTQYQKISEYLNKHVYPLLEDKMNLITGNKIIVISIIGTICISLILMFFLRSKIKGLLSSKIGGFIKGFYDGLISVKNVKRPLLFLVYTALIWVCYYLALYTCLLCLPESSAFGFDTGITAFVFGSLTVMITPGGIGAYPYAIQKVLLLIYGVNEALGASIGWLSWSESLVVIVLTGVLSFILLPLMNKNYLPEIKSNKTAS
ncbi:MAG: lysylphosphatidylglycerol synthase transmembrane domain-containing protein [Bacteroidota bacterium]